MNVKCMRSARVLSLAAALALGGGLAAAHAAAGSAAPGQAGASAPTLPGSGAAASQPATSGAASSATPGSAAASGQSAASGAKSGSKATSDRAITRKVEAELASEGLKKDAIRVSTKSGNVTLKGKVASKADVAKAEHAAEQVAGVKKVNVSALKAK